MAAWLPDCDRSGLLLWQQGPVSGRLPDCDGCGLLLRWHAALAWCLAVSKVLQGIWQPLQLRRSPILRPAPLVTHREPWWELATAAAGAETPAHLTISTSLSHRYRMDRGNAAHDAAVRAQTQAALHGMESFEQTHFTSSAALQDWA